MSESPTDVEHQDSDNSEAAKWRRRLRDTEAERDTLAARLTEIQRGQVESLLERESVPFDALEATGATLTDLLDTSGLVDPEKVHSAAEHARDILGIDKNAGLFVPAEGRIPAAPSRSGFSAAFGPKDVR